MKRLLALCALAALSLPGAARADVKAAHGQDGGGAPRTAQQQHLIGEVTAVDAATGRVTVKTDAGESVTVATGDKTTFRRIPPGESSLDRAERITRADVQVGDRVLVPGGAGDGQAAIRQLIVMSRAELAQRRERERAERQRRGLVGRVAALNPSKKEITLFTRGREGQETVTVAASGNVRFLRYAADSSRASDARPSSFEELKVGDQLRATGERSADGKLFTPEEILAGSFTRVTGVVSAVDAARNEVTVRNEQTGQSVTVALGQRTMVRRIPKEVAEALEAQRVEREQRRAERESAGGGQTLTEEQRQQRRRERAERREREGGEGRGAEGGRPRRGPGGNLQQMLEGLPPITLADLKKGDAVIVTGTPGADERRVTAVALITGDAELLQRLGRRGGDGDPRGLSPGLPGDVMGGGTGGTRDQP